MLLVKTKTTMQSLMIHDDIESIHKSNSLYYSPQIEDLHYALESTTSRFGRHIVHVYLLIERRMNSTFKFDHNLNTCMKEKELSMVVLDKNKKKHIWYTMNIFMDFFTFITFVHTWHDL